MIPVANRQRRVPVTARDVRAVVQAAFDYEKAGEADIAVALVNDRVIRDLNRSTLGHDRATDTLAFSYSEDPCPDGIRGEVLASAETARREAAQRGKGARHELLLYVVHGTLHLLGYDDDTPARRRSMNARAERILRLAGVDQRS